MVKFATCEEATKDQAERKSIQFPKEGDIDALIMFNEDVGPGQRLTIDFEISSDFRVHVKRILVAFAPDTNYQFLLRGQKFEGDNDAVFTVPQKEDDRVTVVIENLGISTETYSGRIEGWGSPK